METCNRTVTNHIFSVQDGSDYYLTAQNLRKIFQEKFKKISIDPCEFLRCYTNGDLPTDFVRTADMKMDTRQPSLADKKAFSQNIYLIGSEDLGKLVQVCSISPDRQVPA